MILETERLLLRELESSDLGTLLAYQSDPRYLQLTPWFKRSDSEVQALLQMFLDWQNERPRTRFQLGIVLRDESRLIGNCGARVIDTDQREAEIGYEIAPACWGNGYATEAAQAMMRFGFERLGMHRISSRCVAENTASARVLEKLGMQLEGCLRQKELFKGRWHDQLIYAILEDEWRCQAS